MWYCVTLECGGVGQWLMFFVAGIMMLEQVGNQQSAHVGTCLLQLKIIPDGADDVGEMSTATWNGP